jgi:hypothetical protein
MKEQFGLELQVDKDGDQAIDKERHNAFLLAHQILIQGKAVSYAEQFQGMYALTRGLVSVLALGCVYWLGFAAAATLRGEMAVIATVLGLAVTLLILANVSLYLLRTHPDPLTRRRIELRYGVVLQTAFWFIGYALGLHCQITGRYGAVLLILSSLLPALPPKLRIGSGMHLRVRFAKMSVA